MILKFCLKITKKQTILRIYLIKSFINRVSIKKPRNGVVHILSPNTVKSLLEFKPVNERIITEQIQGKHGNVTVVQCYALTNDSYEN